MASGIGRERSLKEVMGLDLILLSVRLCTLKFYVLYTLDISLLIRYIILDNKMVSGRLSA